MRPAAGSDLASPTFLLCGGGTGGHVYPALAAASALRAAGNAAHLGYVGSVDGMERDLVARESDLPFYGIPAAPVRGRAPWQLAGSMVALARGTVSAYGLLRRLRPAAILGTGGYVCVPLFLAARLAGVPRAIYLPDIVPGLAVRMVARLSDLVACTAEASRPYFGGKRLVVTGYPARPELFAQDRAAARAACGLRDDELLVLVYGGSRGARSINQAVAALLPRILERTVLIHVCGRGGDEPWLRERAAGLPPALRTRYRLYAYLHSGAAERAPAGAPSAPAMTTTLAAADLAICRSGASTLAELPAVGLPAILVPLPIRGVHQAENADYLVSRGAAVNVPDAAMLGPGRPEAGMLWQQIERLLDAPAERERMRQQSRSLARPNAAARLAQVLFDLAVKE